MSKTQRIGQIASWVLVAELVYIYFGLLLEVCGVL
jgi:hypothetical protein